VTSAHALPEAARARLVQALAGRLAVECRPEYAVDAKLIGGVSIGIGPWVLQANLRDELRVLAGGAARAG
jgi:F-type H+-transporting ATPase subunit b